MTALTQWVWAENSKDISLPLFLNGDIIREEKNHNIPKNIRKFPPLPMGKRNQIL